MFVFLKLKHSLLGQGFVGHPRHVEVCVAQLQGDRCLLAQVFDGCTETRRIIRTTYYTYEHSVAQWQSLFPAFVVALPVGWQLAPGCKNPADKLFKVRRVLSL